MPDSMRQALDLTVRISAIGLAIAALELLVDRAAFGIAGPFAPGVYGVMRSGGPPRWIAGPRAMAAVAAAQVASASVLVVMGPFHPVGRIALLSVTVKAFLIQWRRVVAGDGAEQMTGIVLVSAVLGVWPTPSQGRVTLAVVFIASQAGLCYLTSGLAKLMSPVWRGGSAVAGILDTYGHGFDPAARLLRAKPALGVMAGWTVMIAEVLFPLVFLLPQPGVRLIVLAGVLFHLGCAVCMGLNSFLWAFPATYTCVLATQHLLVGGH